MAKAKNKNELRLLRVFNAPAKLVWEAWTEDQHVSHWWGPRGFTLTTQSKNLKTGGQWIYTMHGPDGTDYPNITTYFEVEPYKRLVYNHGATADREALFKVTVEFKEVNNKTHMDMTMTLATEEAAQEIKKFIKQAGGDSTWDRLSEYVEERKKNQDVFIINRSFETDQKTLFKMWTTPEHIKKWLPPTGATMAYTNTPEVAAGKMAQYMMTTAQGDIMYGQVHYKNIEPYSLLVYTQNFCDEKGNLSKPTFAPTWPNSMLTTVTFYDEGENESRVTVKWEIDGEATEQEKQTFRAAKAGMSQGWTGSFDKLEQAFR